MTDRRPYDPYAPAPRPTTGGGHPASSDVAEPNDGLVTPSGVSSAQSEFDDGLDDMRRVDLVTLAESEGVAAYGTKDDLIRRIRKHRSG